jgi:hypothetical protein
MLVSHLQLFSPRRYQTLSSLQASKLLLLLTFQVPLLTLQVFLQPLSPQLNIPQECPHQSPLPCPSQHLLLVAVEVVAVAVVVEMQVRRRLLSSLLARVLHSSFVLLLQVSCREYVGVYYCYLFFVLLYLQIFFT